MEVDSNWRMELFQPAIAAYGAFSQGPKPKLLKIGEGQYGFVIDHSAGRIYDPPSVCVFQKW